jgi:hypothetical protein
MRSGKGSKRRTSLTFSQRKDVVTTAHSYKTNDEKREYLRNLSTGEFALIQDPLDKLHDWEIEEDLPVEHQCVYGDFIDCLLAQQVRVKVDEHENVDLVVLRSMLGYICRTYLNHFNINACVRKFEQPWAYRFAKRHGLPSEIARIKGTSFNSMADTALRK